MQPYANVMLYLGGPMLLSSAVLWFVYLRWAKPETCRVLNNKRENTVASGWTLYMTHIPLLIDSK